MVTGNDGLVAGFFVEKFVEGLPVADVAPLKGARHDEALVGGQFFHDEWLDWLGRGLGVESGESLFIEGACFFPFAYFFHDVMESGGEGLGPLSEGLGGKNEVASVPQVLPIGDIFFSGFLVGFLFESID